MNRWRSAVTLAGLGAFAMYMLDPDRGKQRRARTKDGFVHAACETKKFSGRVRRDAANRVAGTVAQTGKLFQFGKREMTDDLLVRRVRSIMGRHVSHPRAIEVKCKDRVVELSGWAMTDELPGLVRAVKSVPGVKEVSAFMHTARQKGHIPALQGGRRAGATGWRKRWSPTARVMAGTSALALLMYGLVKRGAMGAAPATAGGLLLARAFWNRTLPEMAGVGAEAGIHIEKTMRILASPEDLYSFWENPENYPMIFSHIREVKREGENTYRWQMAGPPGVPLNWTAKMVRKLPGKLVEWRSEEGSAIGNRGVIHIDPDSNGYTRVHLQMSYDPPAGLLGHAVAVLLGVDPKNMLDTEFVRLKSVFEDGKTHTHGQEVSVSELNVAHPAAS